MSTDLVTLARQFFCGLHGHDNLLEFGRGRLCLKCVSCGHESPGWEIKSRTEPATAAASRPVRKHRLHAGWRFGFGG